MQQVVSFAKCYGNLQNCIEVMERGRVCVDAVNRSGTHFAIVLLYCKGPAHPLWARYIVLKPSLAVFWTCLLGGDVDEEWFRRRIVDASYLWQDLDCIQEELGRHPAPSVHAWIAAEVRWRQGILRRAWVGCVAIGFFCKNQCYA